MIKELPEDYRIILGDGVLATKDDLRTFQAMRVETTGIIRKGIRRGENDQSVESRGHAGEIQELGQRLHQHGPVDQHRLQRPGRFKLTAAPRSDSAGR